MVVYRKSKIDYKSEIYIRLNSFKPNANDESASKNFNNCTSVQC